MIMIRDAAIGQPAVICCDCGGIYLTTMIPQTDGEVEDINMALQLEGIERQIKEGQ
jgi:uncharacterized radical SAM superfamily protein